MSESEETPTNRLGMPCDKTTVRAMAAFEAHSDLKEWTFNPKPMNDDMVDIRITWSGVCHSDIHTIDSDWGECQYPCVPGHEIVLKYFLLPVFFVFCCFFFFLPFWNWGFFCVNFFSFLPLPL